MDRGRTLRACLLTLAFGPAAACGDNPFLDEGGRDAGDIRQLETGGAGGAGGTGEADCKEEGDVPFLWAKRIGAETTTVSVAGFEVADDGTMFAAGKFDRDLVLGPNDSKETTLSSLLDSYDVWVARFAPDGTLEWARQAGGTLDDAAQIVALADDGSVVVGGTFAGTGLFGKDEPEETMLQAAGMQDAFVARFADDGALAWVKRIGGTGGTGKVDLRQILTASDGSLRVLGTMEGTVKFGAGEALETTLASTDASSDQFAASLDEDGSLAWVKRIGGVTFTGAELRADGGLDLRGNNGDPTTRFAIGEPNETALTDTGAFRASYAANGDFESVLHLPDSVVLGGLFARDADGGYHVAGSFKDMITLGKGQPGEVTLNPLSIAGQDADIYVARYDADDQLLWAKSGGGDLDDSVRTMVAASDGTLRLVGSFTNSITLGPGELGAVKLSGATGSGFVANYAVDGLLLSAKNAAMGTFVRIMADDTLRVIGLYNERGITLGEGESGSVVLPGSAFQNLFIAGYGACP